MGIVESVIEMHVSEGLFQNLHATCGGSRVRHRELVHDEGDLVGHG
jgi:hypothetical protein